MKKKFKKIKWSRVAWIGAGLVVFYFSIAAVNYKSSLKLQQIEITVDNTGGLLFVDDSDVQQILTDISVKEGINSLAQVNCNKIERTLERNPYTDKAEAYIDALGKLHVEVKQRVPIIRIINSSAVSFYLDEHGNKMPLSPKFTARVTVANGNIKAGASIADTTGSEMLKAIFTLADFVKSDTFLTRLVDEVWVDDKNEIHIIPKIAGQDILLGDVSELGEKFKRLTAFYKLTFNTNCADYKLINLKYRSEIFATRKDAAVPLEMKQQITVTDTTKNKTKL
jgi:cell division protein FtsQ